MRDEVEVISKEKYFYQGMEWIAIARSNGLLAHKIEFINKYGLYCSDETYRKLYREYRKQLRLLELEITKEQFERENRKIKERNEATREVSQAKISCEHIKTNGECK